MAKTAPDPKRVAEILAPPTASVPDAGYCFGIGRDASYACAKNDEFEVIHLAGLMRVPTAWLRRVLSMDDSPDKFDAAEEEEDDESERALEGSNTSVEMTPE